ncbi:hypothetical protein ACIQU1_00190 [Streptomyces angustmyceticus]|uniref:hypothetical protein n=1 Tax=Streptomyces angustmyceticus TaxID=285578 RepID=UPI0037F89F03
MLRQRLSLVAVPVEAVPLPLTVAGYQAVAATAPVAAGTGESGGAATAAAPFKRANPASAKARHSDIGDPGEAQQLRIAHYGGDTSPDLAILINSGDGGLDRDVRLTKPGSGPGNFDHDLQVKYGEFGTTSEPPAMPGDGWKHFHKPCS